MNKAGRVPVNRVTNITALSRAIVSFVADWAAQFRRPGFSCVGLIVIFGSFTFLLSPEDNFAPAPAAGVKQVPKAEPVFGLPTVVIDPGHGGIDEGTKYYGLAEKDLTLDVALALEKELKNTPIHTILTRREDVYVSLPERAEIANKAWEANSNTIFLSIHFNQSSVESVDGIETYYATEKILPTVDWSWIGFFNRPDPGDYDLGQDLAGTVQSALTSRMMLSNRGIKSRSLYVVRHTRMPAILVEGGFLSNKVENEMLRTDGYRDRLVQGLAAGLQTYMATTGLPHRTPEEVAANAASVPKPGGAVNPAGAINAANAVSSASPSAAASATSGTGAAP